ncbi:MAG: DegT/DnrJ/EryC1/StrS family aminotransferase [Nostocales cyanobacterium ELA608]|jgi:perosamine synthetase
MNRILAINGGQKTIKFDNSHYIYPVITENTKQAVLKQLDESISIYNRSGIIEELEDKFANYHNRKYALLTNSGTAAIHSMFVGANFQEGDEVICPAYTFFATVTPLFFTGAIPVLVDCNKDGNIDPQAIKKKITSKTKAIIVTHMWGIPCEMDAILEIAHQYNLLIFEDASHAHGATYKGKKVGSFGDASAFSLQGQKTISGGEGGILLTDNEEIFSRALLLGHYNKRCKEEIPKTNYLSEFATTGMGLKLRIHPLAAAIANEQFDILENILLGRRKMAEKMIDEMSALPGIRVPNFPDYVQPTWYAYVMQYQPEELSGISVQKFYEALVAEGCQELDRPGATCPLNYHSLFQHPDILFPGYKNKFSYCKGDFPKAERFHEYALKLPVWHNQNDENVVDLYLEAFKKVIINYKELL